MSDGVDAKTVLDAIVDDEAVATVMQCDFEHARHLHGRLSTAGVFAGRALGKHL
jgi:hypothetical protein